MVKPIGGGKYQFSNGAIAVKKPNGQYKIISGPSKEYLAKIRQKKRA